MRPLSRAAGFATHPSSAALPWHLGLACRALHRPWRSGLDPRNEGLDTLSYGYLQLVRALVQRVSRAAVRVDGHVVAAIGPGLVVLLGVAREDDAAAAERLAEKVRALRIFPDAHGQISAPLGEREILCVSQFTLYAETRRGNRPSFAAAAAAAQAEPLYERFCERAGARRGVFAAHMELELTNDGPVTLLLEVSARGRHAGAAAAAIW